MENPAGEFLGNLVCACVQEMPELSVLQKK
jgi:hypothetical protein